MEDDIEGLIHISEISENRIEHPKEVLKEGEVVTVRVIKIDPENHRVGLSIRRVDSSAYVDLDWQSLVTEMDASEAGEGSLVVTETPEPVAETNSPVETETPETPEESLTVETLKDNTPEPPTETESPVAPEESQTEETPKEDTPEPPSCNRIF